MVRNRRRDFLRTGVVVATGGLAGCTGGDSTENTHTTSSVSPQQTEGRETTEQRQLIPEGKFPAQSIGDNWPMHRHDFGHSGYNPGSAGPKNTPSQLWESKPVDGIGDIFVQNGVAYIIDRWGGEESRVIAINLDDGSRLGQFEPTTFPNLWIFGVDENALYLRNGERDSQLQLGAISRHDGSEVWARTYDDILCEFKCYKNIILDGNLITKTGGTGLVSVDADNGEINWRINWPNWPRGTLAATRDVVFVAYDGEVRVFDTETGKEINRIESFPKDVAIFHGPGILLDIHGSVYDYQFNKVGEIPDVDRNSRIWLDESGVIAELSSRQEDDSSLAKFDYDGKQIWRRDLETPAPSFWWLDQNSLYFTTPVPDDSAHVLGAYSSSDGEVRWTLELSSFMRSVLPIGDGILVATGSVDSPRLSLFG